MGNHLKGGQQRGTMPMSIGITMQRTWQKIRSAKNLKQSTWPTNGMKKKMTTEDKKTQCTSSLNDEKDSLEEDMVDIDDDEESDAKD